MEKAFPYIISSPVMTNILKDELGVDHINGTYTAEATPSSNLFTITVKSNSSKDAFNILKAILNCYPKVADYVIGETQIEYITVPELNDKPYTSDSLLKDTVMGGAAGAAIWDWQFSTFGVTTKPAAMMILKTNSVSSVLQKFLLLNAAETNRMICLP